MEFLPCPQFLARSSLCLCKRSDSAFSLLFHGTTVTAFFLRSFWGLPKESPDTVFWVHCCA